VEDGGGSSSGSHRQPVSSHRSAAATGVVAATTPTISSSHSQGHQPPPHQQPSTHHSEADVARVRAALADAGYPNPSWTDIERVFEQMTRTAAAAAEKREEGRQRSGRDDERNVDEMGYTYPESIPPPLPASTASAPTMLSRGESGGLLHYLEPSLRLQRYIQLRERELEEMCLRPLTTTATASTTTPRGTVQRGVEQGGGVSWSADPRPSAASVSQHTTATVTRAATAADDTRPRRIPQPRPHSAVVAMAARHRRAANIVFNATGDQRFRFFPTTPTPQGAGAVVTHPPPRRMQTTTAVLPAQMAEATERDVQEAGQSGATAAAAAEPSRSLLQRHSAFNASARLTPCHNFFNAERGAGAAPRQPGSSVLSSHSVRYLDPQGCTLRRKADPVRRGQQMRLLWEKDSFLSQRRRPQESWRTRQITMAYEQKGLGE
jgi:hypothetical protein